MEIIAKITSGDYASGDVKIIFGPTFETTHVYVNDKEITDLVSILIDMHAGEPADVLLLKKSKQK